MIRLLCGCAPIAFIATAFVMPTAALAQSTGSQEIDEEEIVVTGTRNQNGVEGVLVPDVPKARQVITQELIAKQVPGQSILNTINLIPGVNYTNSDAYGSSGGNLRIRGFDGNRISLTFDGIPLNDTGNYAIFGNQQLDPELIDRVSVNLGATDVDSPTASAAGGTVNYLTRDPGDDIGAMLQVTFGEDDKRRVFGLFDTGTLTSFGTKAFLSASYDRYDKFKRQFPSATNADNYSGEIYKQQYNARILQPIGSGDDFVSVAVNYNQNRNNFFRNPSVNDFRTLFTEARVPTTGTGSTVSADAPIDLRDLTQFEESQLEHFENDPRCVRLGGGPGAQRETTTATGFTPLCTNFLGVRINPSNTGNVRGRSRFTILDNLILTVDPSFQYVLANGGGITALQEDSAQLRGSRGTAVPGVDLNGDGDFLDRIQVLTPNNTNTKRYGVTASLIFDLTEDHRFRVAYTHDNGRHRQTGEFGFLDAGGRPFSPFGGRGAAPVQTADGETVQQRDRLSYAILNQIAGEYRGRFLEDNLTIVAGVRAPFFKRELNQFCFTQTGGSGFATCTDQPGGPGIIVDPDQVGPIPSGRFFAPFTANYKFDEILPNVGVSYRFGDASIFGSYAKGFSAPRTDDLYRAPRVAVDPETTDTFDLGLRYNNRQIQAQLIGWKIDYKNRVVTSFDPELGISVARNIGSVESQGVDFGLGYRPAPGFLIYGFGSYTDTEIQDDVPRAIVGGVQTFFATAGKRVPETPKWQLGGRVSAEFGPFEAGLQGKYVGKRFATDVNDVVTDSYTQFDLDARFSLSAIGLDQSYFQFNVYNLFDTFYLANISTSIDAAGNPNFSLSAPRTITGTLRLGF